MSYRLRCTVFGHTSDVRALTTAFFGGGIVSGSRDGTVRLWQPVKGSTTFKEVHCMRGASHFISCLCKLPPSCQYPHGLILAGSNDCAIYGFSLDSSQPVMKLSGHSDTVCSLAAGNFGTFVSGSWDKTARIWLGQKCVLVLEGHQEAVWAVEIFKDQGLILTGSADKTIRLWRSGKCEKVFKGHELCVRGLSILSETEFLSCSNDHTVRLWKTNGTCIAIFHGHEHYIYSIAILNGEGDFVTSSEDQMLKVWRQGNCVQTIKLPAKSLWAVACLENGDIAVGGSDATIRVFTECPELVAPESEIATFENEILSTKTSVSESQQKSDNFKLDDFHSLDVLLTPGKHDGHTVVCREGNGACAYEWNEALKEWIKIGDVIGSKNTADDASNSQEYDYVFSIDVEDGKYLSLPYNRGENPWTVAQNFIHKHNLNQDFLSEIANFIMTNTGQTFAPCLSDDPFTGADRYIPGSTIQSGSKENTKSSENPFIPLTSYISFDNVNAEGLRNKLSEFSASVAPSLKLTHDEIQELMLLTDFPKIVTDQQMASLDKVMGWPEELIFPALDLFRLAVRSPVIDEKVSQAGNAIVANYLMKYLVPHSNPVNVMLVIRAFCNFFGHSTGEHLLLNNMEKICVGAINCISSNKKVQVAVASLFLNYSVALQLSKFPYKPVIRDGVFALIENLTDSEAIYRALVCIGTLLEHPDASTGLKCVEVRKFVEKVHNTITLNKILLCTESLLKKLDF